MYKDIHCSIASNENELVLQLKDLWRKWFLKIIYKNLTMYNGILCRYFQKKKMARGWIVKILHSILYVKQACFKITNATKT